MASEDYLFQDHPGKNPGTSAAVTLDFFDLCANFWQANNEVALAEFCWPSIAMGYAWECTTAGRTGAREPRWIGPTVQDGSAVWTRRAPSASGLMPISDPEAVSEPEGLTIDDLSVSESTKLLATYVGGVEGQTYDAVFTVTVNGLPRVARQRVPVTKR